MSDLFHKDVPFEFIDKVMATIEATPQHRYQLLTKRAERMAEYFSTRAVPKNVWLGVTMECRSSIFRIDYLRDIPASVRFLSCEPLVESLGEMNLSNIDWVIVGGERGYCRGDNKQNTLRIIFYFCCENHYSSVQWGFTSINFLVQ